MPVETVQHLAHQAVEIQADRERRLMDLLDRLEAIDPELVQYALNVLDDKRVTALWFGMQLLGFKRQTPLQVLALGEREKVLHALAKIYDDLPSWGRLSRRSSILAPFGQ